MHLALFKLPSASWLFWCQSLLVTKTSEDFPVSLTHFSFPDLAFVFLFCFQSTFQIPYEGRDSVCVCVCVCVCARVHAWVWLLSHVWFFMTPWTNCGPSDSSVCGIFWAQMANWRPFFPFLSKHTQIIVKATYLTKMMREKINIKDMKTYNSLHSCQWSPYIFILSWNALTKGKGRLTDFWPPPKQEVIFLIYW